MEKRQERRRKAAYVASCWLFVAAMLYAKPQPFSWMSTVAVQVRSAQLPEQQSRRLSEQTQCEEDMRTGPDLNLFDVVSLIKWPVNVLMIVFLTLVWWLVLLSGVILLLVCLFLYIFTFAWVFDLSKLSKSPPPTEAPTPSPLASLSFIEGTLLTLFPFRLSETGLFCSDFTGFIQIDYSNGPVHCFDGLSGYFQMGLYLWIGLSTISLSWCFICFQGADYNEVWWWVIAGPIASVLVPLAAAICVCLPIYIVFFAMMPFLFPLLAYLKWYNMQNAILACIPLTGQQHIAISQYVFIPYAMYWAYKSLVLIKCSKYPIPTEPFTVLGMKMPFTNGDELTAELLLDTVTDIYNLLENLARAPMLWSISWLLTSVLSAHVAWSTLRSKGALTEQTKNMKTVEDLLQLALTVAIFAISVRDDRHVDQYTLYSGMNSILNTLMTVERQFRKNAYAKTTSDLFQRHLLSMGGEADSTGETPTAVEPGIGMIQ